MMLKRRMNKDKGILDIGSCRRFVKNESMLLYAQDCGYKYNMVDGETLCLSRVGSFRSRVMADGKETTAQLTVLYFATQLEHNIVSYGKLKLKCFGLVRDRKTRALAKISNREVAFDLIMKNNVFYV